MSAITLAAGLAELGIDLPEEAQHQLLAFRDLLLKWNKTYNLTALRDPAQAISHHLLDSLAILPQVGPGALLDVGSGGGLPGIPLAIARPELSVSMVDTVQKKATFLQQAAIELGLKKYSGASRAGRGNAGPIRPDQFARLCRDRPVHQPDPPPAGAGRALAGHERRPSGCRT